MMPVQEYAEMVSCRVGSGQKPEELKTILESNPFSYLHVIKPGIHFGDQPEHRERHYNFARNYFGQMLEQKVLHQSKKPSIYIYRQTFLDGHIFEGIVLGVSIINYLEGIIKKHEYTLTEKESRMAEHVTKTGVVGEPVLLSNPDETFIPKWIPKYRTDNTVLNFYDESKVYHQIWEITDESAIEELQNYFYSVSSLYIADGHHRIAASSLYLTHMHNEENWPQEKMCFMAYILNEASLWIKPFHRIIKGLGEDEIADLLKACESRFLITKETHPVTPHENGEFGVYTRNGWYRMEFRNDGNYHTPAENLDVSRLEKYIFSEILGITDSKNDDRLSFIRGDMPSRDLETLVNSATADMAFVLFPNSMREIKEVADANQTMPPKSTWIEPKLLTGMLIQKF